MEGHEITYHWIPCEECLPEEHLTAFAKLKGTEKWRDTMPEKMSDKVLATIMFPDGERMTTRAWTVDGRWKYDYAMPFEVIAWMSFPEPYENDEEE